MNTTRWKDKSISSLDEVSSKVNDAISDDLTGVIRWHDWKVTKNFPEVMKFIVAGQPVTFNVFKFTFLQTNHSEINEIEEMNPKSGFVIAYEYKGGINYIINQNSLAKKILRKIMKYDSKGEVIKEMPKCDTDFFYWLIYRIYMKKTLIDPESDYLHLLNLDGIYGLRGDTEDESTKITASGESIMNTISALSFFLESSHIDMVKLDLKYDEHTNIRLMLKDGVISTEPKYYIGPFESEEEDLKISKLYLLIYLEIIPILRQEYLNDYYGGTWNRETYRNFLNKLGEQVSSRIEEKIKDYRN